MLFEDKTYTPSEFGSIVRAGLVGKSTHKNKKVEYFDLIVTFDIETTSYRENGEKRALMYEWSLCFEGKVIIGRTWEEAEQAFTELSELLGLSPSRRVVVWVHNLSYEFQFIRRRFAWEEVFSVDERKPAYAVTTSGLEFRCSYILSGYSLAALGKQLTKHSLSKKTGDLDYLKPRHALTPLTHEEVGYCKADVELVAAYVAERLEEEGHVDNIPLTKTGYVRRYCRSLCIGTNRKKRTKANWEYVKLMKRLTLEVPEYLQLKDAFQGGFTHANAWFSGETLHDVSSYDFTSSDPSVMIAELFPMGKGETLENVSRETFEESIEYYCCMFDIQFTNIRSKIDFEHYLSTSHCPYLVNPITDNGRVVSADALQTTITDVDYSIICECYEWEAAEVRNLTRYPRGYLPTQFVKAIIKLYKDKTTLKNVDGREADYQLAKGMLNSCYGMTVTDISKDDIVYVADDWGIEPADTEGNVTKYNENEGRFLYYPWGVWVTAYARRNLWSGILACGSDYIYSDTDSVKILNKEKHMAYIEAYNKDVTEKLSAAIRYHGLNVEELAPCSVDGVAHPLGVWDYEGTYESFKTLGAKRYLTEKDGKVGLTVAGVNKKSGGEDLELTGRPFEACADGLKIPVEATGKNTHTYIDDETNGYLIDYNGIGAYWHEFTSVHLEGAPYVLTIGREYKEFLERVTQWKQRDNITA